jgi:hypothetical protein
LQNAIIEDYIKNQLKKLRKEEWYQWNLYQCLDLLY